MRRLFVFLLAVAILLPAFRPGTAQKFQPKSIQFKGAPDYSNEELMAAADLKKGAVLDYAAMSGHTKLLADLGLFDSVGFKFDGQDLVFTLVPATALYSVHLSNLPLTPGKELDAKLHDRFPVYHGKVPGEGTLLDEVRGALEEMLAAEGIKATVMAIPRAAPGTHKFTSMSFEITAPEVRVGKLHVEGISPAMMPIVKPAADHAVGAPFDTENSAANLEHAIELAYTDEGYAAAKVHAVQTGDAVTSAVAVDVPFAITIEEGRVYKLGAIRVPADSVVSQAEVDKAIAARNERHITIGTLGKTLALVSSGYKGKGYLDCKLTPHPEFDEAAGTVSYTVDISAGPVYHLAFVKFDNVSDEVKSRLMRAWQMLPGDVFNENYVGDFVITAMKADPVLSKSLEGSRYTFDIQADPNTREVNCVIRFAKPAHAP